MRARKNDKRVLLIAYLLEGFSTELQDLRSAACCLSCSVGCWLVSPVRCSAQRRLASCWGRWSRNVSDSPPIQRGETISLRGKSPNKTEEGESLVVVNTRKCPTFRQTASSGMWHSWWRGKEREQSTHRGNRKTLRDTFVNRFYEHLNQATEHINWNKDPLWCHIENRPFSYFQLMQKLPEHLPVILRCTWP